METQQIRIQTGCQPCFSQAGQQMEPPQIKKEPLRVPDGKDFLESLTSSPNLFLRLGLHSLPEERAHARTKPRLAVRGTP